MNTKRNGIMMFVVDQFSMQTVVLLFIFYNSSVPFQHSWNSGFIHTIRSPSKDHTKKVTNAHTVWRKIYMRDFVTIEKWSYSSWIV